MHLTNLNNPTNPLFQLIEIAKQNRQNKLVQKLIASAASLFEIKDKELINDTFYNPSKDTVIYAILFDESFDSLPIHTVIINRLSQQWKKWENERILANDIRTWKSFPGRQKALIDEIWSLVAKETHKQTQLDLVFNKSQNALKDLLELNDKVIACLNAYCQKAIDKNKYDDIIRNWHESFESENIYSIVPSPDLLKIVSFAEK